MIYVDNYNPVLISVFVSILISIASLITILVFFYKGKGNNYLILKLFKYQVYIQLLFYLPQIIFPFLYSVDYDNFQEKSDKLTFCDFCKPSQNLNIEECQQQHCIPDYSCKFQGIIVNACWFTMALYSIISSYIVVKVLQCKDNLEKRTYILKNKKLFHSVLFGVVFLLSFPSYFSRFVHYGSQWRQQIIYYVCNLDTGFSQNENDFSKIWVCIQLFVNGIVIIAGVVNWCRLQKAKNMLKEIFDVRQLKSLKVYILEQLIIWTWTLNLFLKIINKQFNISDNVYVDIFWLIPQLLVSLQGFFYASLFFYCFKEQLVPQLKGKTKRRFLFFHKYNFITLVEFIFCCQQKNYIEDYEEGHSKAESLLWDDDKHSIT